MSTTFKNPIIPGFYPDPSVCLVDGFFYLVTSSFEYFPGLPIFRSHNLVDWDQVGHVLTRASQLDLRGAPASGGLYAPTIRHHEGTFYVTCTNVSAGGNFIVRTSDPTAEWSDPVWVEQTGIDPSLFFDGDHVLFTSTLSLDADAESPFPFKRGIQQSIVNPDTGERLSESRFLWQGTGGQYPEAPHLYRRGGFYYLVLAEGGTEFGHMVTVARSLSPWGPWEAHPRNPILTHRSTDLPVQATGHADMIELDDGTWWMVCLGTRPRRIWHHLGRETFLAPVHWSEDGWPEVEGRQLPTEGQAPTNRNSSRGSTLKRSRSSTTFDGPEWNTLRAPAPELEIGPSARSLTMRPRSASTSEPALLFFGQRQTAFECEASVTLSQSNEGQEAGLLVRLDESHHYDLAITEQMGRRFARLRITIGPAQSEGIEVVLPHGEITLLLHARSDEYRFKVRVGHVEIELGQAPTRYLSSETAGGFTGVYIGLYVSGGVGDTRPVVWGDFHLEWKTEHESR